MRHSVSVEFVPQDDSDRAAGVARIEAVAGSADYSAGCLLPAESFDGYPPIDGHFLRWDRPTPAEAFGVYVSLLGCRDLPGFSLEMWLDIEEGT